MDDFYKRNAIGNIFKKENIYLGTIIFYDEESLLNELKKRNKRYSEMQLRLFIRKKQPVYATIQVVNSIIILNIRKD